MPSKSKTNEVIPGQPLDDDVIRPYRIRREDFVELNQMFIRTFTNNLTTTMRMVLIDVLKNRISQSAPR